MMTADAMTREKQLNIRLSEDEEARLERLASHHGLSAAAFFRKMLRTEEGALLSKVERLQLISQLEICRALAPKDAKAFDARIEILRAGYSIFYSETLGEIDEGMTLEECRFVLDVLEMYSAIERYKQENPKDRETAKLPFSYFAGFDGNNEGNCFGFARFMIDKQDKWTEQLKYRKKTDGFNSHMPTKSIYQGMLRTWRALGCKFELTREEVRQIIERVVM